MLLNSTQPKKIISAETTKTRSALQHSADADIAASGYNTAVLAKLWEQMYFSQQERHLVLVSHVVFRAGV